MTGGVKRPSRTPRRAARRPIEKSADTPLTGENTLWYNLRRKAEMGSADRKNTTQKMENADEG